MAVEPAEVFAEFGDAEVVLIALAIESGFRIRPADPLHGAETAVVLTQMLGAVTAAELERREIHPWDLTMALMKRVCGRLPAEV